MYTEELLKEISVDDLVELVISKLEELEQLEENKQDITQRILIRTDLELDPKSNRLKKGKYFVN